jgi:hypothetical protein
VRQTLIIGNAKTLAAFRRLAESSIAERAETGRAGVALLEFVEDVANSGAGCDSPGCRCAATDPTKYTGTYCTIGEAKIVLDLIREDKA